jgi:uncharacterized protein
MHPSLAHLAHRPSPLPTATWRWRQEWHDLLFLHFPVAAEALESKLPRGLTLQRFDGTAWVSVVAFRMAGIARRPLPSFDPLLSFPEFNVRTYVECEGKAGVWFLSLDASAAWAVCGGRRFYSLPYFEAKMDLRHDGPTCDFASRRLDTTDTVFAARYTPSGPAHHARPGTFVHWVTERYCLFALHSRRGLTRVDVHHAPWDLQPADAHITSNTMLTAHGLAPIGPMAAAHFSKTLQVVSYAPTAALAGVD